MTLSDLVARDGPTPTEHEQKIPWHDPDFSARMLREHLSQDHDLASRRTPIIDAHVRWIHEEVRGGRPGRVLDLGCGPGFYASRLAWLGHTCVGIDYSPASIAHAREVAEREGLSCQYRLESLHDADFGEGFDLALLIFGELNTFERDATAAILRKAREALDPGGALVLEVTTEACARELGEQAPTWFTSSGGLFSDDPHVCLQEAAWSDTHRAALERFHVIDAATGTVTSYTSTTRAYTDAEFESLLTDAGFDSVTAHPSLDGAPTGDERLRVYIGRVNG